MKFINLITIAILTTHAFQSHAQVTDTKRTNSQKILGCWTLKKIEAQTEEESSDLTEDAINSVVCFFLSGKFTTQHTDGDVEYGRYIISKDGKTLYQSMDEEDDTAQIVLIDKTHLTMRTKDFTVYLEKRF